MPSALVSVIIVNWNGKTWLPGCLGAWYALLFWRDPYSLKGRLAACPGVWCMRRKPLYQGQKQPRVPARRARANHWKDVLDPVGLPWQMLRWFNAPDVSKTTVR